MTLGLTKKSTKESERRSCEIMKAALIEIARFDDEGASEYLARHGYYGVFDEPGSVKIARKALAKCEKEKV